MIRSVSYAPYGILSSRYSGGCRRGISYDVARTPRCVIPPSNAPPRVEPVDGVLLSRSHYVVATSYGYGGVNPVPRSGWRGRALKRPHHSACGHQATLYAHVLRGELDAHREGSEATLVTGRHERQPDYFWWSANGILMLAAAYEKSHHVMPGLPRMIVGLAIGTHVLTIVVLIRAFKMRYGGYPEESHKYRRACLVVLMVGTVLSGLALAPNGFVDPTGLVELTRRPALQSSFVRRLGLVMYIVAFVIKNGLCAKYVAMPKLTRFCRTALNLALSYLVARHLALSYLVARHLALSYLVATRLTLFYFVARHLTLSYLVATRLTLFYFVAWRLARFVIVVGLRVQPRLMDRRTMHEPNTAPILKVGQSTNVRSRLEDLSRSTLVCPDEITVIDASGLPGSPERTDRIYIIVFHR